MYKRSILNPQVENKGRPRSNFIYVLFIPCILYLCKFMYNFNHISYNNDPVHVPVITNPIPNINATEMSDNFLSKPYPLSSNSSSTY